MKRLLSSGIAAILCISFLTMSFSSAPSAQSLLDKAVQKLNTINSIDYSISDKRLYTIDGNKREETVTTRIKVVYKGRNSADISMKISGSDGTKFDAYYKDGYIYQNLYGIKSRTRIGSIPIDPVDSLMLHVPRSQLRDAEVTKTEDGGHKVVVRISSELITKIFRESAAESLRESGHTDIQLGLSDFKTTYTIDKSGNLKTVVNTFSAKAVTNKGTQLEQYRQSIRINSTNGLSSVGFPSDLSSYTTH